MLHTAACEKLFVIGACDSHAPVGPAPPPPATDDQQKVLRSIRAMTFCCGRCGSCKQNTIEAGDRAGPFKFVGHLGCKI